MSSRIKSFNFHTTIFNLKSRNKNWSVVLWESSLNVVPCATIVIKNFNPFCYISSNVLSSSEFIHPWIFFYTYLLLRKQIRKSTVANRYFLFFYLMSKKPWTLVITADVFFVLFIFCLFPSFIVFNTKAELLQLNRTQFPSLEIFVTKKVGNQNN